MTDSEKNRNTLIQKLWDAVEAKFFEDTGKKLTPTLITQKTGVALPSEIDKIPNTSIGSGSTILNNLHYKLQNQEPVDVSNKKLDALSLYAFGISFTKFQESDNQGFEIIEIEHPFLKICPLKPLKPSDILGLRGRNHFQKYYFNRPTDDNILEKITQRIGGILITGNPLAGKTRAVYEAFQKYPQNAFLISVPDARNPTKRPCFCLFG